MKVRQFTVLVPWSVPVTFYVTEAKSIVGLLKRFRCHSFLEGLPDDLLERLARSVWKGNVVTVPTLGFMVLPGESRVVAFLP